MIVLTPAERILRTDIYALIEDIVVEVNPTSAYPFVAGDDVHRKTHSYQFNADDRSFVIGMSHIGLFSEFEIEMTWDETTHRLVVQYPATTFSLHVTPGGLYPKLYDTIQTLIHYFKTHPELC